MFFAYALLALDFRWRSACLLSCSPSGLCSTLTTHVLLCSPATATAGIPARLLRGSHACGGLCIRSLIVPPDSIGRQNARDTVFLANCGHFTIERLCLNHSRSVPDTGTDIHYPSANVVIVPTSHLGLATSHGSDPETLGITARLPAVPGAGSSIATKTDKTATLWPFDG